MISARTNYFYRQECILGLCFYEIKTQCLPDFYLAHQLVVFCICLETLTYNFLRRVPGSFFFPPKRRKHHRNIFLEIYFLQASNLYLEGFPGGSMVNSLPANAGHRFNPWVRKIPWGRKWQSTPVFLPGKSHGQRAIVQQGCKESDTTERLSTNTKLHLNYPLPTGQVNFSCQHIETGVRSC